MLNDLEGGSEDLEGGSDDLDDLLDEIAPTYKSKPAKKHNRSPNPNALNIAEQQSAFTRPPNSDGQGGEMNTWDP